MIDLYYWTTPNGHKITMMLEEAGLPYNIHPVNISAGEQFAPEFLKIAPNNRIPAIVDTAPAEGSEPLSLFESGAILQYLAEKTGKFLPSDFAKRHETLQWLYWQMAGLGPMAGQNHHFSHYAEDKIPYAIERYQNETNRLYGVLNNRLEGRDFIVGEDYTIADMACFPWVRIHDHQGQNIDDFPALKAWLARILDRPATIKALEIAKQINDRPTVTPEAKSVLFGQTAKTT